LRYIFATLGNIFNKNQNILVWDTTADRWCYLVNSKSVFRLSKTTACFTKVWSYNLDFFSRLALGHM